MFNVNKADENFPKISLSLSTYSSKNGTAEITFRVTTANSSRESYNSAIELDGYKTLSEDQLVEFKLVETSKGYQAINVKLVKETTDIK